jgi:O-antigen chain-terminating methyltransferase
VSSHQVQFNEAIFRAVDDLERTVDAQSRALAAARAALATAEVTFAEQSATVDELRAEVADLRRALERTDVSLDQARTELAVVRAKHDRLARVARDALAGDERAEEARRDLAAELEDTHEGIYQELERAFRGSAAEIRELVAAYVDDLLTDGPGPIVDVGSGRGELLDVLAERSVEAYGVEIHERFVAECRARGLDVRHEDALAHLHGLPDDSVRAVTAFHVVEHLELDVLVDLIDASLRVLRPGGTLLFETPNPTNLTVGAASFYLDPTHLRPIHPQFLEFLVSTRGFGAVEVRYVHPSGKSGLPVELVEGDGARARESLDHLNWSLFGPLDYAVIARKAGPPPG